MSRIGRLPILIDPKVRVTQEGSTITVQGPAGSLNLALHPVLSVEVDPGEKILKVHCKSEERKDRAVHGLTRALLNNMVTGVLKPYEKQLEIIGIGYGVKIEGKKLVIQAGFCNSVAVDIPQGLEVKCPDPTHVHIRGPDLQQVGEFAAVVRKTRPPEPYKGKGIKFSDEVIKRKPGKAFVSGSE